MTRLVQRYGDLLAAGELRPDTEQAAAAQRLAALQDALEAEAPRPGLVARILRRKPPRPRAGSICGAAWGAASPC